MSPKKRDQPVLPSVLDRLIDDEPENQREAPLTAARVLDLLQRAIQRDMQDLLNARQRCEPVPDRLEATIAGYGVPDLVGEDLGSVRKQKRFMKKLERIIATHEPRFRSVTLRVVDAQNIADRSLRFQIEAVVNAEPAPENMSFNSVVEPVTRTISVRT